MPEEKLYMALGEEANRGTAESSTVGYLPLASKSIPKMEFDEKYREEFRGSDARKGETAILRKSRKWTSTIEAYVFTEAGSTAGMFGTWLKHFFGYVATAQNGATSQYAHMFSYSSDPFATANLGTRALTVNLNLNEGATMKNWPFVGGRSKSLNFEQEPGQGLKVSGDMFGQFRDTVAAEIGSPVFPAENLRCDYNNLKAYYGSGISRTGTAPDYTDIAAGTMVQFKPDKLSVKIEDGKEDVLRLSGLDYPDLTRLNGKLKVTVEMTIDWDDPASGFSSVDDFNAWVAAVSEISLLFIWDTGTPAGTGDNHCLIIDIPRAVRKGGEPDYSRESSSMITLAYEGLLDETTTGYLIGILLKNTASAV